MKNTIRLLTALVVALVLGACSSTGSAGSRPAGSDFASVSLLTMREIRSEFGSSFADNPFFFPTSFLIQQSTDYLVLKLAVDTAAPAALAVLQAEAVDAAGKVRATPFDRASFRKEAEGLSAQVMNQDSRRNKIEWYYLPSLNLSVAAGSHRYVLVLGGAHPFPEDLTVVVRLTLNGVEQDFTLGVPEKQK
jgi:hypothetical protein